MNGSLLVVKQISKTNCFLPCDSSSVDIWKKRRNEKDIMTDFHSDALVFFGATGDLAFKKIFPALQAMVKRGHLNVPVIGVAKAGWGVDELRARARDSVKQHGGLDPAAFEMLSRLLRYVDGDYRDPARFGAIPHNTALPKHP